MAFQPGNQHGKSADHRRPKLFRDALLTALKRTDHEDVEAIQRIADKMVALAESGDVPAFREVADRVEGKVPQAVIGDDENPINLIHRIERVIVRASDPDSGSVPPAAPAG